MHLAGSGLYGMKTGKSETQGLGKIVHEIKRLHCLTGGAFHEIVDGADDYQTVAVRVALEADVAEIGAGQELGLGVTMNAASLLDDTNKRLIIVGLAVNLPKCLSRPTAGSRIRDRWRGYPAPSRSR